jgi:tetratricopeptide (TPR) repeat protein
MSAMSPIGKVQKIVYLYAPQDKKSRDTLDKHLSDLRRQGVITSWHEGEILAGSDHDKELKEHLSRADIILPLISADFIASDYYDGQEMMQAFERHERGEAHVMPILVRSVSISGPPLALLQFLPEDGRPITLWKNRDDAFAKIVAALRNLIVEIGRKLPTEPAPTRTAQTAPTLWKVPYARNPFFTGRTTLLEQLHNTFLARRDGIFVQSLNGLGGIGKTQIALEYAYQHAQNYQAIFWVAADPQGDLLADFVSIAQFLRLPEKDQSNQTVIVDAIKQWFQQHERWLLLFDNVAEVASINAFRPTTGNGHILITTRAQATGTIATPCEIEPMSVQEGTTFLLQRTRYLTQENQGEDEEKAAAEEITQLFGGHPLALDQAGAYVEETGQRLVDYLNLYQKRQATLLSRRGEASTDHRESVTTTFSLAFESVEQTRPGAAELLRFCAFLHPDALPEELLLAGAQSFDPAYQSIAHDPYELDNVLIVLRKYSLVKRHPATKTVSVHRLVQEVLRKRMDEAQQRHWAEVVVRTLSQEFPDGEPASWPTCQRYLPHARVAIHLLTDWHLRSTEAARLLYHVGHYLFKRGEYAEAQGHYEQALELLAGEEEQSLTAHILNNLGVVHIYLARYPQAETNLRRALDIQERLLGPTHPGLAEYLNDLAGVYHNQGKLTEAEPLYQQALAIQEQTPGPEDPVTVRTLGNLALLKYGQKQYGEAEVFNKRVLAAREKQLGPQHVDTGQSLLNLAFVYLSQQRYAEAEPLLQRALTIYEGAYGTEHPQTALVLNGWGQFYHFQQRYTEAEPLFQHVLSLWEKAYGPVHPRLISILKALGEIALARKQYEEAEQLFKRAEQIQEQTSWLEYTDFVPYFRELAAIHEAQGHHEQAESLHQLIAAIHQRFPGEEP